MPDKEEVESILYEFKNETRYLQSDLQTLTQGVARGNIPISDAKKVAGQIRDRAEELQSLVNRLEGVTKEREERSEGEV